MEKSLRGSAKVKNITISKLAAQVSPHPHPPPLCDHMMRLKVAAYYTESARSMDTDPCSIIAKKYKDWPKLLRVKMLYFQALSHVSSAQPNSHCIYKQVTSLTTTFGVQC